MDGLQRLLFAIGKYLLVLVLSAVAVHEFFTGDLKASIDDNTAVRSVEPTP